MQKTQSAYENVGIQLLNASTAGFSRDGAFLAGWALNQDSRSVDYNCDANVAFNADTNLFAIWQATPYPIYNVQDFDITCPHAKDSTAYETTAWNHRTVNVYLNGVLTSINSGPGWYKLYFRKVASNHLGCSKTPGHNPSMKIRFKYENKYADFPVIVPARLPADGIESATSATVYGYSPFETVSEVIACGIPVICGTSSAVSSCVYRGLTIQRISD